jgi:hypothetical protein
VDILLCRSEKVEQLAGQAWAEICWYFPESREQYRITGALTVIGEECQDDKLKEVRETASIIILIQLYFKRCWGFLFIICCCRH